MTDVNIRGLALDFLIEVMEKGALSHLVLQKIRETYPDMDARDRAFLTRLAEGTLERCLTLDYLLDRFSKTPVRKMKPAIRNLLRMSAYQILYMDSVPDSAACNEAVKLAKKRGFSGLTGFVNGVLRNVSRQKEQLPWPDSKDVATSLSVRYSMPRWIVEEWYRTYGQETVEAMLEFYLAERPVPLRLNVSRIPGESFSEKKACVTESLDRQGISWQEGHYLPEALLLSGVDRLDGLDVMQKGWVTVQDESSMLAVLAGYLAYQAQKGLGDRALQVRDVCAAPGGKSLYLADLLGDRARILDCDISEGKCRKIRENQERCGYRSIEAKVWDALTLDTDWIEQADILIADLPCSGLGIMGKKNDIRYKASREGCQELAKLQKEMLDVICRYVRPGGVLIYSTCTVYEGENRENREYILGKGCFEPVPLTELFRERLAKTEEAERLLCEESLREGWLQLLPGRHACDGFYFSVYRKKA